MVLLEENMLEFVSRSPDQTQRLGARLGALLQGGDVICLEGDLGSGKTCLTQGIGRGWGTEQRIVSPSFVLIREYARQADEVTLYHIDLYRISGAGEAWDLGIEELLGSEYAVCVIEWAERAEPLIPKEHLWITLEFPDHTDQTRRSLRLAAYGERHRNLLQDFRQAAFGV